MPLEGLQLLQVPRQLLGRLRQRVPLLAQLNVILERGAEPGVGLLQGAVEQRDALPQLPVLAVLVRGGLPQPRRLPLQPGHPPCHGQRRDAPRKIQLLVRVPRHHRQDLVRQRELPLRQWHRRRRRRRRARARSRPLSAWVSPPSEEGEGRGEESAEKGPRDAAERLEIFEIGRAHV